MIEATENVTEVPADTAYLGRKLDEIRDMLGVLSASSIRQEMPAPAVFELTQDTPRSWSARIRNVYFVFSVSAASEVTLKIGTSVGARKFQVAAADTRIIPLPITIDPGADLTLDSSAGTVTGFLIGYIETDG